jgi:hypothetical protein
MKEKIQKRKPVQWARKKNLCLQSRAPILVLKKVQTTIQKPKIEKRQKQPLLFVYQKIKNSYYKT